MNYINTLIENINTKIREIDAKRFMLLNDITYIDTLSRQLYSNNISNIDISILEKVIKKIDIDEADIFLTLKEILDKFSMDSAETINNFSLEQMKEFIINIFKQLQELAGDNNALEKEIVDNFINILARMTQSLYDREIIRISESSEYQQLNKEVKELSNIIALIKESNKKTLTIKEKDIIYNYLINSNIKDKTNILIELGKIWIEQTKTTKITAQESILYIGEELEPEIEVKEIEELQEQQREEIVQLTNKKTKEEWDKIIKDTINTVKNSNNLTKEQKLILEKILLSILNESLEELNVYEDIVKEFGEITLNSRLIGHLEYPEFEITSIGVDLVLNLIPNLENNSLTEISSIIEKIIEKFENSYLNEEELNEINELIKETHENYPTLSYVTYTDERMFDLETIFINVNGNKEALLEHDKYCDNLLQTAEECEKFIENTYIKLIKTKLEELSNLLHSNESNGLIKKERIVKLKEELELWSAEYLKYIKMQEIKTPYKIYTPEEIEKMDFSNRNAIVFLRGESGKTLYEEGLLVNGLNKNGVFQVKSGKEIKEIIKKAIYAGKDLIDPNYRKFRDEVEKNSSSKYVKASQRNDHVVISEHILYRLSEPASNARVTVIKMDQLPNINREKIGISTDNTVVLVVGSHEVRFSSQKDRDYTKMRAEAEVYENKIKEIISLFENPNTPKEVLLKYIADSYGLLAHLIDKPEQPQHTLEDENKRGGKK